MADVTASRVLQYPVISELEETDVLFVVSASGASKRITYGDLVAQIIDSVPIAPPEEPPVVG